MENLIKANYMVLVINDLYDSFELNKIKSILRKHTVKSNFLTVKLDKNDKRYSYNIGFLREVTNLEQVMNILHSY